MVFGKAIVRSANGTYDFLAQVRTATHEIENLAGQGIFHQSVDSEIAPACVACGVCLKRDRVGPAAIQIKALTSERGHFYLDAVSFVHQHGSEMRTYRLRTRKQREDLLRSRASADVVIFRCDSEQMV